MPSQETLRYLLIPFLDDEDEHCMDNPRGFKLSPRLSHHIDA